MKLRDIEIGDLVVRGIGIVIAIALAVYFNWLFKPAWTIRSEGLYWYLLLIGIIFIICFAITDSICDGEYIFTKIAVIATVIVAIALILGGICSSKLMHAKRYSQLIQVEEGNFKNDIVEVSDMENFPILDVESAKKLGDRSIGSLERTSQYEVNEEFNLIEFQGKQYRVSPLKYHGYFQAINSYDYGIPGYVLVNSVTQDAELVKTEKSINYAPSAKGDRNLKRYLRRQFPSYIFDKFQFDIDEEGTPYYVVPVKEASIGLFGGKLVKSFIIVNAQDGTYEEFMPNNLPSWIDHAYSLSYLMDLIEDHYTYQNGYWNSVFKKEGVKNLSYEWKNKGKDDDSDDEDEKKPYFPGYNSLITDNGMQFFTCITSSGNDESAVGFVLANSQTGEVKFYSGEGAEESTAQKQAESLMQNYGYTSSYPLIVNVEGKKTYILALKDKAKTNKGYAMVNLENYTIAVQGNTLEEVLQKYKKAIGGKLTPEDLQSNDKEINSEETIETTGNITEIYQAIEDGNTYFFFLLENDENLYISSIKNNSKQVQLKVGSNVAINYNITSEEKVGIVSKITINSK